MYYFIYKLNKNDYFLYLYKNLKKMKENLFDWLGWSKYIELIFDVYFDIIDNYDTYFYEFLVVVDYHILKLKEKKIC